jgi:hypothetical protein
MAARREDSLEIARFGDALRNCLGLDPIYQDGRSLGPPISTEEAEIGRFYVEPYAESHTMTPRRGATA